MSAWTLVYEGFEPESEPLRETLCTVGNGYFATRGAAPETDAGGPHYPGTYLAGLYDRAVTDIDGRTVENEDLVNAPNWLSLRFRSEHGDWFAPGEETLFEYRQELDLHRGVLTRSFVFEEDGRRTRVTQRRIVHMGMPHVGGLQTTFRAENWSGVLEVRSAIDGTVVNDGVARYRSLESGHLVPVRSFHEEGGICGLVVRTPQSQVLVGMAARTRVLSDGATLTVPTAAIEEPGYAGDTLALALTEGEPVTVDKVVTVFTSRDTAISAPGTEAASWAARLPDFDGLLESHVLAWGHLWRRFRLETGADDDEARALNLHVFHLLQTVSKHTIDLDAGVPARGLHGEAYRGHIFWDELFIFPFLNLHLPDLTKALLLYRYRRLPEARQNAAEAGLSGALYPWQSGSNGREESQTVHLNPKSGRWIDDNSRLQRHVNLAIAYNVWQYYQATGDSDWLAFYGAEMLVEIARMLGSLSSYDRATDRYEIKGVMGPDEYHDAYPDADRPGLDNNTYTNVMTVWVLERTDDALAILPRYRSEELWEKLGLSHEELDLWRDITHKMRVVYHDGVLSQFEGYGDLEEFDWLGYAERYGNIQRLDRILEAEGDTPNRYKASKQADALMLFYLLSVEELTEIFERLGYPFDDELVRRTIDYYDARTAHGSTLSRIVHSWVLARSDRERSWELFQSALFSDLSDIQGGTTREGIHLGAMAGTVDLVQRGYTGLEVRGDVLRLDPAIPSELGRLDSRIRYRGVWIELGVTPERVTIRTEPDLGSPVTVALGGQRFEVPPGSTREVDLVSPGPPDAGGPAPLSPGSDDRRVLRRTGGE